MEHKILKILFVSRDKFPPFRVDVAVLFGKEMKAKRHTIDWILQSEDDCKRGYQTKWSGGNVWVTPTNNGNKLFDRTIKHFLRFFYTLYYTYQIIRNKYDLIQAKDCFFTALFCLIFSKLFHVKFFYWLSYPIAEASIYSATNGTARYPILYLIRGMFFKLLLYKILLKYADHIFVQSLQMQKDINAEGIPMEKMTVVPMGIEIKDFNDNANKKIDNQSEPTIVYLGTLTRLRKIDFVIRVFSFVRKEFPSSKLLMIGGGETKKDIEILKNEAIRLGIENDVIFTGFIDRKRAFELIRSADICVSPFFPTPVLNSTSPTKLIEYMALGKPVVANQHPEQELVIKESGGGICVPYSEKPFADAIIYLLKHPSILRDMGIRGRQWVLDHRSYSIISDIVESSYYKNI